MNPEAPQQVFVLLLALTCTGVVGATVMESGVLTRATSGASADTRGTARAPSPAPATDPTDDAIEADSPEVDGEPAPGEGSGLEDPPPNEGSAAAAVAAPPTEGSGAPAAATAPLPEWEPLREGTRREPCLAVANRATMATGLARREPTGTEGPFVANGEPIIVFLDFANSTGVSQEVSVIWTQQESGASYLDMAEAGAGSRWRTWVQRPLPLDQLGHWSVRLMDAERCLIQEIEFELVAPHW